MAEWAAAARAALAEGPTALVTILATEGSAPRGAGTRMLVTRDGIERHDRRRRAGASHGRAGTRFILDLPPGAGACRIIRSGRCSANAAAGACGCWSSGCDADWLDAIDRGEPIAAILRDDRIDRAPFAAGTSIRPPHWASPAGPSTIPARGPLLKNGDRFIEPLDRPRRRLTLFGAGHVGRAIARIMPGLPIDLAWYDSRPEAAEHAGRRAGDEDDLVACAGEAREEPPC
jgi:xanthine dehydrogenase accessory factor